MGEFFGTIYDWFNGLFGTNLSDHLWGWDDVTGGFTKFNQYLAFGFIALGLALLFVFLFYYIINHPRFNRWWSWLIVLTLNGIANFIFAWQKTLIDLHTNVIAPSLLFVIDPQTGQKEYLITDTHCFWFGVTNAIVTSIFFIIFSFLLRKWSRNCSTCPIPN